MKNYLLFIGCMLLFTSIANAQVPQGIPYQAVARNGQGQPLASTNVKVRFSVLDSTAAGNAVYVESHNTTTSALGLFTANVGMGTASTGTFSSINWGQNFKFLKVELDTTATGNSYIDLGTQQMMSVPYALYALKSGQGNNNSGNTSLSYKNFHLGFVSSTTWICPQNVTEITVELWGGGGGGGNTIGIFYCTYGSAAGSGGNGGYNKALLTVVPGNIYSIVVGNGGISGGGDGSSSSFGSLLTAEGGKGGMQNSYSQCIAPSGQSGQIINYDYSPSFTPPSYIPQGFTTLIPGVALGGSAGAPINAGGGGGVGLVNYGAAGQAGFCKISY